MTFPQQRILTLKCPKCKQNLRSDDLMKNSAWCINEDCALFINKYELNEGIGQLYFHKFNDNYLRFFESVEK